MPERCSPARVRYAAPKSGAPLPAARRSGETTMRWAASMRGLPLVNRNPFFFFLKSVFSPATNRVCHPTWGRQASLSPPQRAVCVSFRRICPQPPYRPASIRTLVFTGAVWGPQFTPGAAISRLELAACSHKQWFSRPCPQSPELGDLQSEISS